MADTTTRPAEPETFIRDGVSADDIAGRLLGDVHIKGSRLDAAVDRYIDAVHKHLANVAVGSAVPDDVAGPCRRLSNDVRQAHADVEEALKDLERRT